jgi:hypothetical protein
MARARMLVSIAILFLMLARPAAAQSSCGQPVSSDAGPTASDALFILRAAVGSESCEKCVCDVDASGGASPISAADALRVLRRAVGQAVELTCSMCDCTDGSAPTCEGTCPTGTFCTLDRADGAQCVCRNECELSAAPTCGGSCASAAPDVLACQDATFRVETEETSVCLCLPPDLEVCVDAAAPTCAGLCPPGAVCVADPEAGCVCETQPLQASCDDAVAPACAGTCDSGSICIDQQGDCVCADASIHPETCGAAQAPACGGACASGRLCAAALGRCECFQLCDVSAAPTCGGECASDLTCVDTVASLGGSDLHICQCRER